MGKKYLLYIHEERFQAEKSKSELINRLLANHYEAPEALSHAEQAILYESAKKREQIKRDSKVIRTPQDVPRITKQPKDDYCQHGYSKSLRLCKKGCK